MDLWDHTGRRFRGHVAKVMQMASLETNVVPFQQNRIIAIRAGSGLGIFRGRRKRSQKDRFDRKSQKRGNFLYRSIGKKKLGGAITQTYVFQGRINGTFQEMGRRSGDAWISEQTL